jgi:uncharacterized protein (DUF1015 family)
MTLQATLCSASTLDKVIAPPYDVVTREQVKVYTQGNPHHFLNVTRPEALMEENVAFNDARVYQTAHDHWERLLNEGIFKADIAPHFYVYAMEDAQGKQFGLVSLVSVQDYKNGLIRKHELTRPDKENDRVKHIQAVNGQLSPVLLAVKDNGEIASLLEAIACAPPTLSAQLQGVTHELWTVTLPEDEAKIKALLASKNLLYVADGHHRSAAALRVYEESPKDSSLGQHPECLAVTFPSQHMRILGYHRTVSDLNGLTSDAFLEKLKNHYKISSLAELSFPKQHGVCHMILGDKYYSLTRKDSHEHDPILSLDVSALSRFVLTPILGIEDIRTDPRIGFMGGRTAVEDIATQVSQGKAVVGFLMFPTQMDELLAVADANQLMPPKSTWFEPKLADGLFCYSY